MTEGYALACVLSVVQCYFPALSSDQRARNAREVKVEATIRGRSGNRNFDETLETIGLPLRAIRIGYLRTSEPTIVDLQRHRLDQCARSGPTPDTRRQLHATGTQ